MKQSDLIRKLETPEDFEVRCLHLEQTNGMDAELKQYLIEMEERLKGYVSERCEQVETNLLTGFHAWASPAEARSRTISAALRAIDLEREANAALAKKLEGRRPQ